MLDDLYDKFRAPAVYVIVRVIEIAEKSLNGLFQFLTGHLPPAAYAFGVLFDGCSEFIDTKTMAERKTLMMQRADAFVMAPGGIGTYEEFFEVLTLKQLGRHNPPLAVLNTLGYYDAMQAMLEHTVAAHFAKPICLQIYRLFDEPAALMEYLEHYDPDEVDVRHIKNI